MPEHRISAEQRRFARVLRRDQTSLEDLLWRELRGRRLGKWKFRRQVPVESFVADFFCPAARLIIEANGPHHASSEQRFQDAERDAILRQRGFRILRFSSEHILSDLARVVSEIRRALENPPHPPFRQVGRAPSPAGGRRGSQVPRPVRYG